MGRSVQEISGNLEGKDARIAIVASKFNEEVVSGLINGAVETLQERGVSDITLVRVPGAFEIPSMCRQMALSGGHDAIIALGAVIKGETDHYHYICESVARGLTEVSLDSPVPVLFGVLTAQSEELAFKRSDNSSDNKGREAALSAIEMVSLYRKLRGEAL